MTEANATHGTLSRAVRIGFSSVRANLVPMVVLWGVAVAIVVAYFHVPAVRTALEPVARFQRRYGIWAGLANQFVFCGMIPCVCRLVVQEIQTERPVLKSFLQSLWSGCWGVVYVGFYAFQTWLFGAGNDFGTLVAKTAFDEFVWAPFVPVPATAFFCLWMESGFSVRKACADLRQNFVRKVWLPTLLTNWCIWIPAVLSVYSFPSDLQVQVLGLVGSVWALITLKIGRIRRELPT